MPQTHQEAVVHQCLLFEKARILAQLLQEGRALRAEAQLELQVEVSKRPPGIPRLLFLSAPHTSSLHGALLRIIHTHTKERELEGTRPTLRS
jgi:hypothetical protein